MCEYFTGTFLAGKIFSIFLISEEENKINIYCLESKIQSKGHGAEKNFSFINHAGK